MSRGVQSRGVNFFNSKKFEEMFAPREIGSLSALDSYRVNMDLGWFFQESVICFINHLNITIVIFNYFVIYYNKEIFMKYCVS